MAVTVKQKFIHMAPRKLRLVADTVRGQGIDTALTSLLVSPRIAAKPVMHAIKSAANAAQSQNVTGNLMVKEIFVDEGPALKRRILKSRGRASRMEHRMSHITVTLDTAVAKAPKRVPTNARQLEGGSEQPMKTGSRGTSAKAEKKEA
jgi:large subunit ribosomal protein L22